MEIKPDKVVTYSLDRRETLVHAEFWVVEERVKESWVPLNWTSGPVLSQEDAGRESEFHRVSVQGIAAGNVAVGIFYDGKATDIPSMGAKISVHIQPFERGGTFRLAWVFRNISASALQFERRLGDVRSLVRGPVEVPKAFSHRPAGDNSVVALARDLATVRFGMNWEDAIDYYQGATATVSKNELTLRIQFGDFALQAGERFLLDPKKEGGGGGGGGGAPSAYIYNVNVNRNSLSGTTTTITWSTYPSDACDTFQWGTTTSYGNTVYPACGTHSVTLTGLERHRTYYYKITSSKSGYYSGTYSGSWYPTDASLDTAYESYNGLSAYSNCDKRVHYTYSAETPGDISYDPTEASNSNSREVFDMQFHWDSWSEGGCFGNTIAIRDLFFEVWVWDSAGVVDWISAKDWLIVSGYSGGSGTVTWGISVGAELKPASVGFSASYSAPSTPSFPKETWNRDVGGGWQYFGWFGVRWPTNTQVSLDAMWPVFVWNQQAQYRLWDKVLFKIRVTMYWDTHSIFGWYGNNAYEIYDFLLGDGTINGVNLWDQYTNVQSGYMTGPEE